MSFNKRFLQFLTTWFGILLLSKISVHAQNLVVANPANIVDARSSLINPAIISLQPSQVLLGMQLYHVGFLENNKLGFRNNYLSMTTPYLIRESLVLGLMGQYFGLPIYQQSLFSITISNKFNHQFAIGMKYNLATRGYDRSNFDQIDEWDPVFANGTVKSTHSFGLGILFTPIPELDMGFSWDHINRPNVSLANDTIHQPYIFDFGIKYAYKAISTSIHLNLYQHTPMYSFLIESRFLDVGLIRVGYEYRSMKLEGQIQVANGVSLNYSYSYPLYDINEISTGTHQMSIIYNFHHLLKREKHISDIERRFPCTVELTCDQLKIINKKLIRSFDESITSDKIDNVSEFEAGVLDSTQNDENFYQPGYHYYQETSATKVLNPKLSDGYMQKLQALSQSLESNKNKELLVIHKDSAGKRALQIKSAVLPAVEKQVIIKQVAGGNGSHIQLAAGAWKSDVLLLFPEKACFRIKNFDHNYTGYWRLMITNYSGQTVKIIDGTGKVNSEIYWDWKDDNGLLLSPEKYSYAFHWIDENGRVQQTKKRSFDVVKINRRLAVEITSKQKQDNDVEYRIKLHQ